MGKVIKFQKPVKQDKKVTTEIVKDLRKMFTDEEVEEIRKDLENETEYEDR